MGKNIKIVASIVPLKFEKGVFRFAVALTPRLPDSGQLSDYYTILNWCDYIDCFKDDISIVYKKRVGSDHFDFIDFDATTNRTIPYEHSTERWNAMFKADDPVSGWILNELPYDLADAITQRWLNQQIREALNDVVQQLMINPSFGDENDPFRHDGDEEGRRQHMASFAEYVEGLKSKGVAEILNDPILLNARFRPLLASLWKKLDEINTRSAEQRSELLLRLSIADLGKRNFEETNEFHKKFSAYSSNPILLYHTGWIREYEATGIEADIRNSEGFLQIAPHKSMLKSTEGNARLEAFQHEIDFVFPHTAVDLRKLDNHDLSAEFPADPGLPLKLQDPSKKKLNLIFVDPLTGYVRIKDEDRNYEVTTQQVDKAQILARIEEILKSDFQAADEDLPPNMQNRLDILNEESERLTKQLSSSSQEYITSGISIEIENLKEIIEQNLALQPDANQQVLEAISGSGIIYRHNLIAGFRLDVMGGVIDGTSIINFLKGSLCQREEYFSVGDPFLGNPSSGLWPANEGMVVESTQGSNSGRLYVDEELCRWNDASLIAGDHGNFNDVGYVPDTDRMQIEVQPRPGSVVPLRFGWRYSFALRTADIIGRSQVPIDFDDPSKADRIPAFTEEVLKGHLSGVAPNAFWTPPIYYQRVEAVNSPLFVLGTQLLEKKYVTLQAPEKPPGVDEDNYLRPLDDDVSHGRSSAATEGGLPPWIEDRWGEDIFTMVIRSHCTDDKGLVMTPGNETVRYVAPPKANWNFVVQHGVLDEFFILLKNQDERSIEEIKNEFLDAADTVPDLNIQKIIRGGRLSYMFDPVVEGFEFIIDNLVSRQPLPTTSYKGRENDIDRFKYWEHCNYYKLELTYDASKVGSEDGPFLRPDFEDDQVNFYLRQGCEQEIVMGCYQKEKIIRTTDNGQITIPCKNMFLPGIPQTRRASIRVVHAVQKPCLITRKYPASKGGKKEGDYFRNEILTAKFYVKDRMPGSLTAYFRAELDQFPVLTADTYVLHMHYFNWVSDRQSEMGYRILPVARIVKTGFQPKDPASEDKVVFEEVEHLFDDTRFVMVQYKLEAISKFRKYFKPPTDKGAKKGGAASEASNDFSIFALFNNAQYLTPPSPVAVKAGDPWSKSWTAEDYKAYVHNWIPIKASKPPAPPVIDKVVPLMRWDEKKGNDGVIRVTRHCDTVRIYFQEDWYTSGPDEQVAVFFMNQRKSFEGGEEGAVSINSGNILVPLKDGEIGYDNVISQFGLDPIHTVIDFEEWRNTDWQADPPQKFLLNYEAFDRRTICFEYLPSPILLERLDFDKPKKSALKDLKTYGAIYPIQFATGKSLGLPEGKFYIDIQLDSDKIKQFYFPFVKFAVARYQRHADATSFDLDYRFSKVVVTDFVPLLPYRELTVNPESVELYAPSIRTIDDPSKQYKTTNELYILEEHALDGASVFSREQSLRHYHISMSATPSRKYTIHPNAMPDSYMVAEYEVYTNPGDLDQKHPIREADPQNNYLKRLVFSYYVNNSSKSKYNGNSNP